MRRSVLVLLAAVFSVSSVSTAARAAQPPASRPTVPATRPASRPAAPATKPAAPATAPAAAKGNKVRTFAIPGRGGLTMNVPESWGYGLRSPRPGLPPTIAIPVADDRKFSVQLTVVPAQGAQKGTLTADKIRALADGEANGLLASSKETKVDLFEVQGEHAAGYGFTLTDKAPNPGSYEYITPVFLAADNDVMLAVTILHHQKDAPERQMALDMVRSAHVLPEPAAGAATAAAPVRVDPAVGNWSLLLPGKGLSVMEQVYDPARKMAKLTAVDADAGLIVSVYLEPAAKPNGDAAAVRDHYWTKAKASPLKKEGVKQGTAGEWATVEYTVPEVGGRKVDQRNVNLYGVRDGVWIDVHVSKANYAEADKAAFDAVTAGVAFDPPAKK